MSHLSSDKLNFTVGPVMSSDEVLEIGSHNVPYFRTSEFSEIMHENESLMKEFAEADDDARVVFITGSGTASMEAVVMNLMTKEDRVIVINGGSFGHRFVQLLELHEIPFSEIKLNPGKKLSKEMLEPFDGKGYTAFLVNINETSTGVLYDIDLISDFCNRNNLFLCVDAISSFLADDIKMAKHNIGVMITGSQKALACPPGISILVLSASALKRLEQIQPKCMYLDLKLALKNGERGQTPFTPAVGILLQINCRLKEIKKNGGVSSEVSRMKSLAENFRENIKGLPFEIISESLSNAVTPLHPTTASAHDIFITLKDEYGIWVCPNGGELKDSVFRVGHLGNLTINDNNTLINAFKDLKKRGII